MDSCEFALVCSEVCFVVVVIFWLTQAHFVFFSRVVVGGSELLLVCYA